MRRRHGASANFAPPEPLGRALRLLWVPAVLVWIVHPYLTAFIPWAALPAPLRDLHLNRVVGLLGAAVGAAALAGTLVCWKRMGKSWRMGINPDEKTQLIVSGPYGYVRHPIYALQSILALATALAVPSPLMIAVAVTIVALLQWEARREEKYLRVHHGRAYDEYCRRVGRFVPRSLAPFDASGVPRGPLAAEKP
jgi:protein-S-isoprenylcysteine O-methyltransferase Ste14